MVQCHGAPHHVVGASEPFCRQVGLDGVQPVTVPGLLDPLLCDLHHSGRGVGHDRGADTVGEQDAQPTRATADIECPHPGVEIQCLLDGPGDRHLPLLVVGVVVPCRCLGVKSLVFVHVLEPNPRLAKGKSDGHGKGQRLAHGGFPTRGMQRPSLYAGLRAIRASG